MKRTLALLALALMLLVNVAVGAESADVAATRKKAEAGDAAAQFILGLNYANGDGMPKDLVQAHVWWNIAGASGNAEAKSNLAIVEKQMTADQKAEAMKLARELFAKIEANKAKK